MLEEVLPEEYKYKIIDSDFVSNENFTCVIRVNIKTEDDFFEWFKKFKRITYSSWLHRNSKPISSYHLSKDYVCHCSAFNKKAAKSIRNKKCKAFLKVRMKRNTKDVQYHDHLAKAGYFTIIKIHFVHSHKVNEAEALNLLPRTSETKQTFIDLFESGMSPAMAKNYHESLMLIDSPDQLGNRSLNPPVRWIYGQYLKWSKQYNETMDFEPDFQKVIESKIFKCREIGCDLEIEEDPFTVVIVTPVMFRMVLTLEESETIFIDSTTLCDQARSTVTLVFVATKGGAIPIGVAIHDSQTEQNFSVVFSLLKAAWNKIKMFTIDTFMTDDCKALKDALSNEFPPAKQLTCQFHILRAFWRWLCNSKNNNVQPCDRKTIMSLLRKISYSSTLREFNENVDIFINSEMCKKYDCLLSYIEPFLLRKEEWCLVYHLNVNYERHTINKYSEAIVRIFKDLIVTRLRSFNAIASIEFTANILDKYVSIRLLDIALGRLEKHHLLFQDYLDKGNEVLTQCNIEIIDEIYHVKSQTSNMIYTVDDEKCSCLVGIQGAFCKHQAAVFLKYGIGFPNAPTLNKEEKELFHHVAVEFAVDSQCADTVATIKPDPNDFENMECNNSASNQVGASIQMKAANAFKTAMYKLAYIIEGSTDQNFLKTVDTFLKKVENVHTTSDITKMLDAFSNEQKTTVINSMPFLYYPVLPMQTSPIIPLQTNSVIPMQTNPVIPMQTNPVIPMQTNPVIPLQSNSVIPLQTNPVIPLQTSSVVPMQTTSYIITNNV